MYKNLYLIITVIVISLTVCFYSAYLFYIHFFESPGAKTWCKDSLGNELTFQSDSSAYRECIKSHAKNFIERDFEVAKDLSKAFLTLLAALLVGSITFSEKIVNVQSAKRASRILMICCWLFLLIAIICCGVALAFMSVGAGWASYQPFSNYTLFELKAIYLYVGSGLSFGAGLVCLLAAGIVSINERQKESTLTKVA
jgi:hypothetical protein